MDNFFSQMTGNLTNSLLTCAIARILSVDFERMVCVVQPENAEDDTPIEDVPFGFMQNDEFVIRFPYKEGDRVFIGFCKEDIDPVLFDDGNREGEARDIFQLKDAFVIGGVQQFTKPNQIPSGGYEESLLICRKDFNSRIEIDKDGKVIVETNQEVILKGKTINFNP